MMKVRSELSFKNEKFYRIQCFYLFTTSTKYSVGLKLIQLLTFQLVKSKIYHVNLQVTLFLYISFKI
jgi:hypothetical protein